MAEMIWEQFENSLNSTPLTHLQEISNAAQMVGTYAFPWVLYTLTCLNTHTCKVRTEDSFFWERFWTFERCVSPSLWGQTWGDQSWGPARGRKHTSPSRCSAPQSSPLIRHLWHTCNTTMLLVVEMLTEIAWKWKIPQMCHIGMNTLNIFTIIFVLKLRLLLKQQ